jgi:ubiquitin C-terminal hydrolase
VWTWFRGVEYAEPHRITRLDVQMCIDALTKAELLQGLEEWELKHGSIVDRICSCTLE